MWTDIEDVYSPLENGNPHMLATVQVFGFGSPVCGVDHPAAAVVAMAKSTNNQSLSVAGKARILDCHHKFFTYKGGVSYGYYPYEAKLAEKKYAPG